MLRFDVLTLFPELFDAHFEHGVTRRAYSSGAVQVRLWPLRDFGQGPHQRVDDRSLGGGPGMVMTAPALDRAVQAAKAERGDPSPCPVILFSPTGRPINQAVVQTLAQGPGAVLICGRYEGVDQRLIDRQVTDELSLGDFVLSGGEIPALALLDAVARLQDGVLHDPASHQQDSFGASALLDHPHYTQPAVWEGEEAPAVLSSGHHARIERWRREAALALTARRRPELIEGARREGLLTPADEAYLARLASPNSPGP